MLKLDALSKNGINKRKVYHFSGVFIIVLALFIASNFQWKVSPVINISQHIVIVMLALFIWNVAFIRYYSMHKRFDLILGYAYLGVFIFALIELFCIALGYNYAADWIDIIERIWLPVMLVFLFPRTFMKSNVFKRIKKEKFIIYTVLILVIAVIVGILANNIKQDTHSEVIEMLNFATLIISIVLLVRVYKYKKQNNSRLISTLELSIVLLVLSQFMYSLSSSDFSSNGFYAEIIELASFTVLAYGLLINVVEAFKYQTRARLVLVNRNKDLELIDKQKDEFVGFVSHQLRTPLTAIKWRLDFMKDDKNNSLQQIESINLIDKSNQRLIDLVNMFLNITRLNLNKYEPVIDGFRPYDIIHNILDDNDQSIAIKGLDVSVKCPHDKFVNYDKTAFSSITDNLITNAIKYCRQNGKIQIDCTISNHQIIISVEDNGIGIPESMQVNLFKPFTRLGNANKTSAIGTGYGLYFVHKLVTNLGGIINFESKEDQGATFTIKLPLDLTNNKGD